MRFDWLISGSSEAALDRQKAYWTRKSKAYFNNQAKWTTKVFYASFSFLNESFTVNEKEELEKKFPF